MSGIVKRVVETVTSVPINQNHPEDTVEGAAISLISANAHLEEQTQ